MSQFAQFMKKNQKIKENVKYAPSKWLTDDNDVPLEFEIRPLTIKENDQIVNECTNYVMVGKRQFPRLDVSKYTQKMVVASVVFPNLHDKELQDSYGAMSAEQLVTLIILEPGEYTAFTEYLQEFNGFTTLEDEAKFAKN